MNAILRVCCQRVYVIYTYIMYVHAHAVVVVIAKVVERWGAEIKIFFFFLKNPRVYIIIYTLRNYTVKGQLRRHNVCKDGGLTSVFIANGISEQQRGGRHTHTSIKFSLQTDTQYNVGSFK